ncbi:MAG: TGB3 protein [Hainan betaflexivirus]|nr:MAG: TGB3 protein [Hainan betaflexivirus]
MLSEALNKFVQLRSSTQITLVAIFALVCLCLLPPLDLPAGRYCDILVTGESVRIHGCLVNAELIQSVERLKAALSCLP